MNDFTSVSKLEATFVTKYFMNAHELIMMLPERYQPDLLEGEINSLIHIILTNELDEVKSYSVRLENEKCTVSEFLQGEPNCTIKANDTDYADVELGKANAQWALLTGKISCDNLFELVRFIGFFKRMNIE